MMGRRECVAEVRIGKIRSELTPGREKGAELTKGDLIADFIEG